ncbi:MAG: hypothetical protein ABEJ58_05475 [Halodesulfurarchaeum sp.]
MVGMAGCTALQGPQGPEGPEGPQGPEGPPGPQQMAFFDLATQDDGSGYMCSSCHSDHTPNNDTTPNTPGDEYDLLYEANAAANISEHRDLPEDPTYTDCLECHAVNSESNDNLVMDATNLRGQLHEIHMGGEHFEGHCFSCHEVNGTAPDSPSYQFLNASG